MRMRFTVQSAEAGGAPRCGWASSHQLKVSRAKRLASCRKREFCLRLVCRLEPQQEPVPGSPAARSTSRRWTSQATRSHELTPRNRPVSLSFSNAVHTHPVALYLCVLCVRKRSSNVRGVSRPPWSGRTRELLYCVSSLSGPGTGHGSEGCALWDWGPRESGKGSQELGVPLFVA